MTRWDDRGAETGRPNSRAIDFAIAHNNSAAVPIGMKRISGGIDDLHGFIASIDPFLRKHHSARRFRSRLLDDAVSRRGSDDILGCADTRPCHGCSGTQARDHDDKVG
ncbi:hypothetical protein MKK88_22950 [Methylobacterium sp. E-005]|uniref:hypothetical protein n=1 Tax=Methylobacterium sp. E-005 TaxID=2836549 RepID=UPI001FBADFCD|nr:hypothetical protein [Methylobacterium sp. E-005]MCJ2088817.1 hypothetical protein [Methylobacterium sp. E-005]